LGRRYVTGRFSGVHDWPVLGVHGGTILVVVMRFPPRAGLLHVKVKIIESDLQLLEIGKVVIKIHQKPAEVTVRESLS
jgi:hypothetical protein